MRAAAHALMRRFRRTAVAESVAGAVRPRPRTRMRVEEIEPRVLYSADFAPAVVDQSGTQIQMRVVETPPAQPAETQQVASRELVIVDTAATDYQTLVDGIVSQADSARTIEVMLIDGNADGIQQITEALAQLRGIDAVHLVSHGVDGAVRLGSSVLDIATLQARAAEIGAWASAFGDDGDLLIYGCDVAASENGRLLVDALARLTGADVAASEDATGHATQAGDWNLEYQTGAIDAGVAITAAAQNAWLGVLGANTVIHSYDVALGSLSESEIKATESRGQTFTYDSAGATYTVDKVGLVMHQHDGQTGTITVSLRDTWNGPIIASGTISASALTESDSWINVSLTSAATLNDNQTYVIRVDTTAAEKVYVGHHGAGAYAGGEMINKDGVAEPAKDLVFRLVDADGSAPVLNGAVNLSTLGEDPAVNAGDLVSALIAGQITDPAAGALSGIAVTAVDNTNGTWQYSLNSGSSWNNFGSPSASSARVLAADADTYVRFVPNANYHGTVTNGLTFRAWDQTSGIAGGTADTTSTNLTLRDEFGSVSYTNNNGTAAWNGGWVDSDDADPTGGTIRITGGHLELNAAGNASLTRQANLSGATSATLSFSYTNSIPSLGGTVEVQAWNAGTSGYDTLTTFTSGNTGSGTRNLSLAGYFGADTRVRLVANSALLGGTVEIDDLQVLYAQPLNGNTTAFSSATASSSITVNSLNDAPAGTNTTVTTIEETAFTFGAANFGFSDANDSPAHTFTAVTLTTVPAVGSLALSGVAVTAGQSVSVADINAGNLVFTPVANGNGAGYASFTFQVQDDGGTANGGVDLDLSANTMTINVTAVNDEPSGADNTVALNEDTPLTFGTAHFGFTDVLDGNSLAAVRITTLPAAGSLALSGVAVTAGQFVSAANIAAGNLVYTPVLNASGAGHGTFTFQVRDSGGTANGGVDLDATPNTMTVNVTALNDAPAGTNTAVTVLEDGAFTFGVANFGFSDPVEGNAFSAVTVTTVPAAGTLTLSGVAVTAGQSVSVADISAGNLVFTPVANGNGAGYASFTFQVQDDGGTANGGVDLDPSANTMTINVTAVNDAPAGTNNTVTTNEDTALTLAAANFGFTDPADSGAHTLSAVTIATVPIAGALTLSGLAVTAGQSVSLADINAGNLVFTPVANANGAGYASFTFQVQDSGGTANGGVDLDASANTMTINVTSVNDTPAGADNTVTTNEDTAFTFSAGHFGFTDAIDGNSLAAVTITTLPTAGSLRLSGTAVTAGQSVSAADITAGNLVFTPAANANGAAHASFTFQVQDDGGTANGGINLDPSANTMTVNVTSVNDAPVGTNTTVTTNEDTAFTFSAASFGFSDPNDAAANSLTAVTITTLPVAGALALSGVAVTAGQSVSVADINAGNLVFTPVANANGAGYASFTFQVQDDGGTANGGADLDQTPRTLTVNVTAVNDAPAGTDNTVTTNEDTGYAFAIADFGFTDPSDGGAHTLSAVTITTVPVPGALALSGVAVTAGQSISAADIAAGNLVFTPSLNANGAGYASFTFQVRDSGGTANGGVDLDASANTMTINVTAVNDAPAGSNTTVTVLEDAAYVFAAADFGFSDASDSPANTFAAVQIATLPAAGSLTLSGVAVTAGQLVAVADITAGNLVFAPAINANGTAYASFTFQVQDNGGTANGGVNLDQSANTLTIDVTAVNDAPTGADTTVTTNEDTAFTFSTANFGFGDAIDGGAHALAAVTITTLPAAGTLTLSGVAVTAGQSISAANIAAGNLVFTPAPNANGTAYTSFTFQVQDSGGTANGGVDVDPSANTMTIDVTSVNDAPAGADNTIATNEDTAYAFNSADFGFSDTADGNTLNAVRITTIPVSGSLALSGVAVTAGQIVTAASIDAGNLVFTPASNANGAGYASFTFQVRDNGGTANGGVNLDQTPNTMSVNVTAVNDAPSGTNNTVTTNEDTGFTFTAAHFGLTDATDSGAHTLSAVTITTVPAAGALTLSGVAVTAGQSVSVADLNAGNLVFTPASNAHGAGYASFTFQVRDSGGTANGGVDLDATPNTMAIDVTSVNDAPVGTNNTITINEDTNLTFSAAHFGFTDTADSPANALTSVRISTLPAGGTLRLSGVAVTAGQSIGIADLNAGNLVYTPAADGNGAGHGTFTFQVQDDGGTANGGVALDTVARTMTIDVTAVADAPRITGANNLTSIFEDQTGSAGTLVSALIAGQATDPDAGSVLGIAVTGVVNTNGTWQYSTNGGGAWSSFGAVSAGTARLLAADANTYVRFVPNANFTGTVTNGITFRAWDQTSGTNGGVAPTIPNPVLLDNFSAVSYGNNNGTASWTADWVDVDGDPGGGRIRISGGELEIRTNSAGTSIYREANLTGATAATLSFSYNNEINPGTGGSVIVEASSNGGGSFTTIGTFSDVTNTGSGIFSADISAYISGQTQVRFTVAASPSGGNRSVLIDNFQIAATAPGNGGTAAFSTATASSSITVTPINDAPAGTNNTVTALEDTAFTFTTAHFGFTDPNDSPANTLAAVRIATLPAVGSLTLSGVAVTAGQTVTAADIAAGNLRFTAAANANGAGYTSFTFQVQDNGGTANGGVDLDASANTMTINVTSVNDAPAGTNNTVTTNEDTAITFSAAMFGFTDPNDTPANSLSAVRIATTPAAGSLTLNGVAVSAGQSISVASINAGNLRYTPGANASGVGYASFTFQVQDNGGTGNGGVNLDQSPNTMTIDVTAVNDAPVGASTTVSTLEEMAFTFATAHFGFTDPTDGGAHNLAAVRMTTLPPAGALTLSGVAVTAGQLVTAADIAAGNLVYTPAADANGAGYTSFTFQVQDDGGTANGGVNLDTTARTLTVDVTPVNDAPAGTNATVSTPENTVFTFGASNFGFTDPTDAGANSLAAVHVTTLPAAGTLALSGVAVTAGQVITLADLDAGNLRFTPALNANGLGYASFTFQVQDDGGTADGGVDLDASPNTMTINVASVNNAPVGADNNVATNEDTPFTFAAADFGFSDPSDGGANALSAVRISTLPAAGTIALSGVAVTAGQFVSVADINAGNLQFVPAANANGAGYASFTFNVQDDGGTASGGIDLDQVARTMTVNVTAVNDAPVGTNTTVTTLEDTAFVFSATDFGFTDPADGAPNALAAVRITALPAAGALTLSGVAVTAGQMISAADIGAGNLVYTPVVNANGAGYASFGFRVQDDGGTANSGVDIDTIARTMTIDVTAVNDAPAGTTSTVATNEDTPLTFTAAHFGFADATDSGAHSLAAVTIATLPAAGSLTLSGVAVVAGQSVSAADIVAGNLVFAPAANANGSGYASFTFQVQDSGGMANGGVDTDPVARTLTIDVVSVNDAPIGTNATLTTAEETPIVLSAASFGFTDPADGPANGFAGVRIASVPTAGTLTISGVAVIAGQTISAADLAAGNVVFTPALNAVGVSYSSFTFQVQDDGGTASGGVSLDAAARTLTIDVTSVNDPPVGTATTVVAIEDTPFVFTTAAFGFTDPSDSPSNNLLAVTIGTLPAAGSLTLSGVAVTAGQSITAASIAAGNLVFTPAANANGVAYTTFTFQVQDDAGGADLDTTARTMTIDVTAVNDAPAGANVTVTTNEDTAFTFAAADFGFTDPVDGVHNLAGVRITAVPAAGALRLGGVAVTAGQLVSAADIAAGNLVYTPAANGNGAGYASFAFQVEDDGGTANGGTNVDPVARTMTIDVTAVNDAPAGTSTTIATLEETPLVLNAATFGYTDPNDAPSSAFAGVTIASLPTAGALTLSGVAVTAGQSISAANLAAGNLVYTPAVNGAGAAYASFTFRVQDDGGTANGGVDLDTLARTLTIDVTPVNDAPVGTTTTVVAVEDTPFVLAAANFGFNDPSDSPAHNFAAVTITSLPGAGALTLSGVAVVAGDSINVADLNAGNLVFTPAANANGAGYASFAFRVQDGGGTANGGTNLDAVARTLTIDVTAVNDAPAGADNTVVTNEDTALVFTAAHFGHTDAIEAHTLAAVRIASLPAAGTLALSGAAVSAGQLISAADINAGNLVFTPAANANGAGYASFTFQVQDSGGTASGGIDIDPVARTMTVDVTAVNDAPTGVGTTVTVLEDVARAFTLADFGFADAADTPANAFHQVRVASLPAAGVLRLNGAAVAAGDFIEAADIAAGRLIYTPPANVNGASYTSFTFQVRDDGGGSDLDTVARTLTIDIASVNDAPVGAANTVTTNEDVTFAFNAAAFGFTDPFEMNNLAGVRITALPAAGTLRLAGTAVTAGQVISVADLNAGLLAFDAAANANGVGYASFTFQVQDDGGTANGGVNTDTVPRTMTINVTPVSDAPVGTDTTVTMLEDTTITLTNAMFGFTDPGDAPANSFVSVTITSLPSVGRLTLDGNLVTVGQIVTTGQIGPGRLAFHSAPDGAGAAYASFTFRVQDDGSTLNGGENIDAAARTLTIDVTPVNDPPVNADNTIVTLQHSEFVFTPATFNFSDPQDTPGENLAAVHITSVPNSGSLRLNNIAVTSGQVVSAADIASGRFVYAPGGGAGNAYASFTFRVQDSGPGANVALANSTITVNVTPAPTTTTTTQVVDPNVSTTTTATTQTNTSSTSSTTSTTTATTSNTTTARVDAQQVAAAPTPREAEANVGATVEPPRPNTGFVQVALQRSENQAQPNRDTRSPTVAAVSETQVLALVSDRASDSSATFTSAQSRSSEASAQTLQNRAMLFTQMNQIREDLRHETKLEATAIAATAATSVSLSVGYVIWLLRGGALVSTLLSSVPAWRFVDPLPVLGNTGSDSGMDDEDDSLESLVSQNDAADDIPVNGEAPVTRETATT